MQYLFMTIFAAGIIAADQLSKLWVVQEIQMYEQVPAIQGLFHLTHVHNYGAAWSSFQGMIWLFALIFGIFTLAIIWEFLTKKMGFTTLERWCIAAVWGGGMGNMIDRLRLGYVVDMIEVDFMSFPVFNVADCFITCGCILLMLHLVFFNKDFWKDEKK